MTEEQRRKNKEIVAAANKLPTHMVYRGFMIAKYQGQFVIRPPKSREWEWCMGRYDADEDAMKAIDSIMRRVNSRPEGHRDLNPGDYGPLRHLEYDKL